MFAHQINNLYIFLDRDNICMYKAYSVNRPSVPHPATNGCSDRRDDVSGQIIVPCYWYSSIQTAEGMTTGAKLAEADDD